MGNIKIVKSSDATLNRNYDNKWRESASKIGLAGKIEGSTQSCTPQSAVDAIAAAMDAPETIQQPVMIDSRPIENIEALNSKEQDIARMMRNYVMQNGGIIQDNSTKEEKPKKNQILLG
jgi:hypothetical protein